MVSLTGFLVYVRFSVPMEEVSLQENNNAEYQNNNLLNSKNSVEQKVNSLTRDSFVDWCNTLSGIQSIYLVTPNNRFYTSSILTPSKSPVKKIKINWDLWNVFLCVVPDISDKKDSYEDYRVHGYNSNTILKIWGFAWYYDVWYSTWSQQFYDYDSNNTSSVKTKMYWKYYLDELPLYQIIDLQNNIIFADIEKWWTQTIYLKDSFKSWNIIPVWWYMNKVWNDGFYVSSIREFKILWDWEWSIEILD